MAKRTRDDGSATDEAEEPRDRRPLTEPVYWREYDTPEEAEDEQKAMRKGTKNLRYLLMADPNVKRRTAIAEARATILHAIKSTLPDVEWKAEWFVHWLNVMSNWSTGAKWKLTAFTTSIRAVSRKLYNDAIESNPFNVIVNASLNTVPGAGETSFTPLGPDVDRALGVTTLHLWEFSEQLQGAGLGSTILSAMTTMGMIRMEGALLAITGCHMPTFLVTDGRYGFQNQSEWGTYTYGMAPSGNPLMRFPPVLEGDEAGDVSHDEIIAWTTPSLRTMFEYMQHYGADVQLGMKPGAYNWSASRTRFQGHPLYRALLNIEHLLAKMNVAGPAREDGNAVWKRSKAHLDKFDPLDPLDPYANVERRFSYRDDADTTAPHPALRNPLRRYHAFRCSPGELVLVGILPDIADRTTMSKEDFWLPLDKVAPLRAYLAREQRQEVLVLRDIIVDAPIPKDLRVNMQLIIYFFISVARELGLPVVFDTRGVWQDRYSWSIGDVFRFDRDNSWLFDGDEWNVNGPAPFIASSERVPGVFWFYPQPKPRSFIIPPDVAAMTNQELERLPVGTSKRCIVDMVVKEGMPAPLLGLLALRPLPKAATASSSDEPEPKKARLVACTHCARPEAQFMTADGAFAFCGAHCQRRFEEDLHYD